MASFTTGIQEQSSNGSSTTYAISSSHTAAAPRLVISKMGFATGNKQSYDVSLDVVYGLVDADGAPISARLVAGTSVRVPLVATSTEVDAILVHLRDFVASDEFTDLVKKQLRIA